MEETKNDAENFPNGELTPVVGVGPWPADRPRPIGEEYDPTLLAEGDRRNVPDRFRYWTNEAITAQLDRELEPDPSDLSVPVLEIAIENIGHDFNIGSIIRTANGLGVRHVHIVGRRRFNRRGAMVTDRYLHVHFHQDAPALAAYARSRGLTIIGMDNLPGAKPLEDCELPQRCLMIFGEESQGLTDDMQDILERLIQITQYGSTRSLNVGHAAAISMWAWVFQNQPRRPQ
ncbi:MAG: RNA methyltransferase [Mobiluncus porci]|uniref:TrmH family RNA methyltransferase n=1 Tax=Mobiluncus TaxID=2050 RepID=UPI0023EFC1B9|nr:MULTISPECIES: RNA methyltransferase [Mobiluncus]MCI6585480.1 RNA methyltransferase [Mobiluncus sp.]MDD7541311.1 RNA methyltransferase [Mobiluncus porci]MDY5747794.1 RNA methyltransferase [Mobiluncus porci]